MAGATFVFTDVSAYERGQQALRTTMEQQAILEHAPVGIVVHQAAPAQGMQSAPGRDARLQRRGPGRPRRRRDVRVAEAYHAFRDEAFAALAQRHDLRKGELPVPPPRRLAVLGRIRASAVRPESREAGTIWILEDVSETRQALRETAGDR
jgi:hypothetical protein